ncbi:DUF3515 domain-containing protein [Streptomyces sp. NP160]|uniref:DUF3515 domain-containing protein n=1 Tax=Streptomyces sp. NP160 TaxID=2586637 RepID=UPI00111B2757|nr:DUF3515 domain-containing protein [Streptomyces sp. NP160]TNM68427.1 DUF3515 domain-containing protein [Streptomyces sp. NP160]
MNDGVRSRSLRLTAAALVVVPLVSAGLAGCVSAVGVEPAPGGYSQLCSQVYTALPDSVAGLQRRETTAQGAAAWSGVPTGSSDGREVTVVLRCGVDQLSALDTAGGCQAVEGDGAAVDWIPADDGDGRTTWTTYGREPAVSLQMPADASVTSAVPQEVASAVSIIEQTAVCS